MLAYMFMDAANKKLFGYFMKNMQDDYALGNENYPTDMETELQVLLLYQEGTQKKTSKKEPWVNKPNPGQIELAFAQMKKNDKGKRGPCFKCGKKGHKEADCPELQQQHTHVRPVNRYRGWHHHHVRLVDMRGPPKAQRSGRLCEGVCWKCDRFYWLQAYLKIARYQ
uniref:CCHC-type domain-containing protein n=1 Tax=Amphora coffeiformis TaxID=265554 RepID=A0A6S8JAH4_9STRA|eukprot:scaffold2767_cov177-Amphora_coffeaeformis.AAC.51